jgi:hypothetical protein
MAKLLAAWRSYYLLHGEGYLLHGEGYLLHGEGYLLHGSAVQHMPGKAPPSAQSAHAARLEGGALD